MSNIITISREFGSGGRELGKRLAEYLNVPIYDHEIIEMVAHEQGLNPKYVSKVSESDIKSFYPTTIGNRFNISHAPAYQPMNTILAEQDLIKRLAEEGDCVIVGRGADILLREMHPFNIFVYADVAAKLERCSLRAKPDEKLTAKDLQKKMKKIDKDRAAFRALFTEEKWGHKESYHLCINTSGKEIKYFIPAIAEYSKIWFGKGRIKWMKILKN